MTFEARGKRSAAMHGTSLSADFAASSTIADGLARWAVRKPDAIAVRLLRAGLPAVEITYGELERNVCELASVLREQTRCGDRALLLFKTGPQFVTAFLACLRAGLVAVPVRLPTPRESQARLLGIAADCQPSLILTQSGVRGAFGSYDLAQRIIEIDRPFSASNVGEPDRRTDLALLQYTSGTTGTPKGVMISHENLLSNTRIVLERSDAATATALVSWLPHFHDMGLVGTILAPLAAGLELTLMAPADFLRRPLVWLEAISRFRAEIAVAPNFAFDLCAQRLEMASRSPDVPAIDLSCLRVMFVGAETVHAATLSRFAVAAEPFGFSAGAFLPCYGLAESTLFVDGVHGTVAEVSRRFAADDLAKGVVRSPPPDGEHASSRILVACGRRRSQDDSDVVILSQGSDIELTDGSIGTIAIRGPCVSQGYWGREATNEQTFRTLIAGRQPPGYFRTGDLGFYHDDLLFVIGRGTDLIVMHGVNFYPQDIEEIAATASLGLPAWRAAAFLSDDSSAAKLVVMQEAPRSRSSNFDPLEIVRSIQQAIFDNLAIGGAEVLLIAPGSLPRTPTGKIRRGECRAMYQTGAVSSVMWRRTNAGTGASADSAEDAIYGRWREAIARLLDQPASEIDLGLPISAYPLDSLKLIELYTILETQFGITRSAEDFLGARDLRSLIHDGTGQVGRKADDFVGDSRMFDGVLPSAIRTPAEDILVTGATGMLGANVIKHLLGSMRGKIHCLVRNADDLATGATSKTDRVTYIPSLLSQPRFGLPDEQYARLVEAVGVVIHCAADVNFLIPYRDLRAVNVEATGRIIEFASTGPGKRVIHVSSLSVLEVPAKHGRSLGESEPPADPEFLANGYAQSKWVADVMMLRARERGFDISVCRAPWLLDLDAMSMGRADGFIRGFLLSCLQLGRVPDSTMGLNLVAVDFVGRAVAALAQRKTANDAVYHLGTARPLAVWEIANLIGTPDKMIETEMVDDWINRVERTMRVDDLFPLKPYAALFNKPASGDSIISRYLRHELPTMNSRNTHLALRAMGFSDIPSDEQTAELIRAAAVALAKLASK
jgi:thioester reductase-like protein